MSVNSAVYFEKKPLHNFFFFFFVLHFLLDVLAFVKHLFINVEVLCKMFIIGDVLFHTLKYICGQQVR